MRRLELNKNKQSKEDRDKFLKQCFDQVCETEGGIEVLRYILKETGYQMPCSDAEPNGKLIFNNTIYNVGRANLWLMSIRPLLMREHVMLIENPIPVEPDPEQENEDER